jgi:hypothetical protein
MDPEVLLPSSQIPASSPYPEPDASSPHFHTIFPEYAFQYCIPAYA